MIPIYVCLKDILIFNNDTKAVKLHMSAENSTMDGKLGALIVYTHTDINR